MSRYITYGISIFTSIILINLFTNCSDVQFDEQPKQQILLKDLSTNEVDDLYDGDDTMVLEDEGETSNVPNNDGAPDEPPTDNSTEIDVSEYKCDDNKEHKVKICHIPGGNADALHTICVGKPALKNGHTVEADNKAHGGDYLGDCEPVIPPEDQF